MEYRRRKLPWVFVFLGAMMALCALAMLSQTANVLQYSVIAPEAGEKGENIRALMKSAKQLNADLTETVKWVAMDGAAGKVSLSIDNKSEEANLIAIDEGWLEVYPRFLVKGRRIGESELMQGAAVIMLDDGLAFKLFGTELPEDAEVKLGGQTYSVVGTVRHAGSLFGGRGVGDTVEYDAYIPLAKALSAGVTLNTLTLSAVPLGGISAALLFEEKARENWLAGGDMIYLAKESMRRETLPRVLLLIVGLYALYGLFRRMTSVVMHWFEGFAQAMKESYFKALIPRLLWIILMSLAGYAALIGVTYLLMLFSVQPLYVFTEWVPENIVEWSSIAKVFWNLTSAAAQRVRIATRELRVVEFWGGILRWGMILVLLGVALLLKKWGKKRAEN